MPEVTISPYSKLNFTFKELSPETASIVPRLRLRLNVDHTIPAGQQGYNILVTSSRSEFHISTLDGRVFYATTLLPDNPLYIIGAASSISLYLYAELDHYKLKQIEKLREGKDLNLRVNLSFMAEPIIQSSSKQTLSVQIDERIAKSDWVERILPQLGLKDVALIEIPKINKPEFGDLVTIISEAWKQYSMGEYDNVLTECRKAMECIVDITRKKGFEKEATDEKGNKKTMADWGKALGDENLGDIIGTIIQKHFGFLAPGAHYGKAINRSDAEVSILLTLGIAKFIADKLSS